MTFRTFTGHRIQALVFDVLGTVVDEGAARTALTRDAVEQADPPAATETTTTTAKALYEHWAAELQEAEDAVAAGTAPWRPVEELSRLAFTRAADRNGVACSEELLQSLSTMEDRVRPWPEAAAAMQELRRTHLVAGLTNGSLAVMARMSARGRSTEAVQSFKPSPAAYAYAIDRLSLDPDRTLFVAAHPWDLRAAATHGFRTAFVNRPDAVAPTAADRFDLQVQDLADLSRQLA
jgi:2-haloacid dehalogenase